MKDCTKIMMCYNFEYIKRRGTRKMKKFIEEFKTFALRGNVMDMAVGVIIGGAFSGIVTSLTDNFINPILNVLTGGEHILYPMLQDLHLHFWHRLSTLSSWRLFFFAL